ncbi:MAG: para-aminobenzoate synthetase component 1 [Pseudohongiellaceae bacterium]|jgi:para-aminobenzoate synthetase component 1
MTSLTIEALSYTPDSSRLFSRIRSLGYAVFLDSANPYTKQGRYDVISAAPIEVISDDRDTPQSDHFFKRLEKSLSQLSSDVENPHKLPFIGGAISYFSYDLGRQLEQLPATTHNDANLPIALAGIYTWAIINDHQEQHTWLVAHPQAEAVLINQVKELLDSEEPIAKTFQLSENFTPSISKDEYQAAFNHIHDYIQAGDCYQINLTQRFCADFEGDPWQAYQQLRSITAAPFSAFMEWEGKSILSLSPERFIQTVGDHVSTAPIKGTRKRSDNPELDRALAEELINSGKDRAENLMIVDLLRNDLGKNCQAGSINVVKLFELQSFETVHHLVSTINGTLNENTHPIELLAGAFPGGSITGAPKFRAMQIIEELESHRRSVYCGSIGYISCDGHMDTNIAIRTLTCNNNRINCWAGGGIVADSQCEDEYQECFSKVGKILATLESSCKR